MGLWLFRLFEVRFSHWNLFIPEKLKIANRKNEAPVSRFAYPIDLLMVMVVNIINKNKQTVTPISRFLHVKTNSSPFHRFWGSNSVSRYSVSLDLFNSVWKYLVLFVETVSTRKFWIAWWNPAKWRVGVPLFSYILLSTLFHRSTRLIMSSPRTTHKC